MLLFLGYYDGILAKKGAKGMFQVDGVKYVLGIKDGHIRQLYPKNECEVNI